MRLPNEMEFRARPAIPWAECPANESAGADVGVDAEVSTGVGAEMSRISMPA